LDGIPEPEAAVKGRLASGPSTALIAGPVAAAVLLVSLIYWPTLHYGFYYDDYHFVRPYTAHEVAQTFYGSWDTASIETPYYRPLTICFYAVRFAALGLNARANHAASLLMFALAGTLLAIFAGRITASRAAGLVAAVVFAVHPGLPYAAVGWVTNQMHLAELIVVLTALLWWFFVRHKSAWWIPLLAFQAAALLIKEDGVMVFPAVVVLHTLRKWIAERELRHVPWTFLLTGGVTLAGLLLLRAQALQGFPSHRLPSFDHAWGNWTFALDGAFRFIVTKRPWLTAATWFATLVLLAAVLLWRWLPPGIRFAFVAGLAISVLFVLPFAFIVKREQLYLIDTGAALSLTAGISGLFHVLRGQRVALIASSVLVAGGVVAMAAVARNISGDFDPFSPVVLRADRIVEEWAAVPVELREYLASKRTAASAERPDPDPSRALPIVAYGFHGRETSPDGVSLRWMAGPTADIFVRRGTRLVTFAARHERGAFREPAHVRIDADGRLVTDTVLDDGRWHEFAIPLRQRAWTGLGGMHHIRLALDHAWIPAKVIPGSGDGRTLGLQIGLIETR
jgi:hypothetical protein